MRKNLRHTLFLLLVIFGLHNVHAGDVVYQGFIKDSISGEPLPFASVIYKGTPFGTEADLQGFYRLETDVLKSDKLEFSYLGYKTKVIDLRKAGHRLNVRLSPEDAQELGEVVVKGKRREKYRRKGNPSVELMKKVIAHRDSNDIRSTDYYAVKKYEKTILGLNNVQAPEDSARRSKRSWGYIYDYIDSSEISNKTYLPVSVRENLSDISYQKSPERLKRTITAQNNKTVMNIISEEMIDNLLNECFTDVQIYDNNIDIFIEKFMSPLSVMATTFYHFYITDTVTLEDGKRYTEMTFIPANTSDLGFTGYLYISTDSSYAVKKVKMDIPRDIKLNLVEKLHIEQDYTQNEEGRWAITHERMISEIAFIDGLQGGYAKRDVYYTGYKWHDIDKSVFAREENIVTKKDAKMQSNEFWAASRPDQLSKNESRIDTLVRKMDESTLFNISEYLIKTCIEGYMTIGKHGYFDYGRVMSTYSRNELEGNRFRVGGRTNPALNNHLFLDGYLAYGTKDERLKYKAELEYSFREKEFSKMDFPRHSLMANINYDWDIPSERFLGEFSSSFIHSFKREKVSQFAYVRSQTFQYLYEKGNGFGLNLNVYHSEESPAGDLRYIKLHNGEEVNNIEQTSLNCTLSYAPGISYYQNKSTRYIINKDIPQFTLGHSTAAKGLLGTQYNRNKTEFTYRQKYNLTPLGYTYIVLKAGKIWEKVPYPLLFIPAANLSYTNAKESFWLMNNMEFLTDQYASLDLCYNMNGFLLGRIPGIRRLHLKEVFRFKAIYGGLSDKNNPFLEKNADDHLLYQFPTDKYGNQTSFEFGDKPYMEVSAGLHNLLKVFRVEVTRRLNYLDHPKASKWGINVGMGLYM